MSILKHMIMPLALAVFLLAPVRPAQAQYVATAELERDCLSKNKEDIAACVNYVAGVIDYHVMLQSLGTAPTISFCLPANLTKEQAAVVVMAYLRTRPQHDAFIAAAAIPLALNKTFPCRDPHSKKR
ncbi:MAG: hypothetical protein GC185_07175 [Alphaproteobacteria bacterium]|nr:hypothetical protein [Alphaproteobacteria bacterium]